LDIISRLPVSASEVSRWEAVAEAGLEGDDALDVIGNGELQALIEEAHAEFGATDAFIASTDHNTQTVHAMVSEHGGKVQPAAIGFKAPTEVTLCKHVLAKGEMIQSNGSMVDGSSGMQGMPNLSMAEHASLAAAGHQGLRALMGGASEVVDEAGPPRRKHTLK
jgi:hypothetical protein